MTESKIKLVTNVLDAIGRDYAQYMCHAIDSLEKQSIPEDVKWLRAKIRGNAQRTGPGGKLAQVQPC